jgi:hypothetical protein
MWVLAVSAVVAALMIGGVIAYIAAKNNTSGSTGVSKTVSSISKHQFAAVPNINQPFIATIENTLINHTTTTTLQSDGHGNRAYIITNPGMSTTTIYTSDAYYVCNNSLQSCKKYSEVSANSNSSDPGTYTYSAAQIKNLRTTTKYGGQQKCPNGVGTCNVWFFTTQYHTTTYYYVNAATKQIVQYIHHGYLSGFKNDPKVTIKITYTYKNVHITIPTNYTIAPQSQ